MQMTCAPNRAQNFFHALCMHNSDARLPAPDSRTPTPQRGRLVRRLIALLLATSIAPLLPAAEPGPIAYPVGEPPLAAQLSGIDPEWNFSFKAGGKVRVMAAGELAYWGRFRDAEAGPQVLLADGGIVCADVLLVDEAQ